MLRFGEFVVEGGYNIPVVSVYKDKVDLDKPDTRNEINRNIAAELSRQWMTPYGAWNKVRRILEMYSIELPKIIFQDSEEGEEVVAISQFGHQWGASLDGTVTQPNVHDEPDYFLYFSYGISVEGFYDCHAIVTDEDGLEEIIGDEINADEVNDEDISPEEQLEVE